MPAAITVHKLTKRYESLTALSDISFEVQPGAIVGFLGPNGAGKTTMLRILTGFLSPTAGSVKIDGLEVARHSVEIRRRIGYLPEHVSLYPELRVQEYLDYRARIKGVAASARRKQIQSATEQCDISDVRRQLIGRLSKGYRQRVALADCLLAKPKILILDEPTIGLDPHQIRQTRELIQTLGRTTTILLSTHILPEVEMICQQVTIIDKGRIIAVDSPQQLRQRLSGGRLIRVQLRGDPESIKTSLMQLPGVARVIPHGSNEAFVSFDVEAKANTDVREAIFRLAVERQWVLRELVQVDVSLEDVFIHLTTKEHES